MSLCNICNTVCVIIVTHVVTWFYANTYCGISTDCSAIVTRDGLEQMGGVFEIGVTV